MAASPVSSLSLLDEGRGLSSILSLCDVKVRLEFISYFFLVLK
jgi:hypothetical protein